MLSLAYKQETILEHLQEQGRKVFSEQRLFRPWNTNFTTRNSTGWRGRRAAVNDCWCEFSFPLVWTWGQCCALTWGGPGEGAGLWEQEKNVNSAWVMVSLKILMKHLRGDEKAGNWTHHLTLGKEAWVWEIKSIMWMVINTLKMQETT